jgi:uncharacterized protein YdhG (YjbR/CyaY superfamily)
MPSSKSKPATIDEYLAGVTTDQRTALEALRKTIRSAVPEAEEGISYGLAAFRLNGRPLVAFGAAANHCAFYPMSSTTIGTLNDELDGYETSKGTIRFQAAKPLPSALVRKVVKARIAEISGAGAPARASKSGGQLSKSHKNKSK